MSTKSNEPNIYTSLAAHQLSTDWALADPKSQKEKQELFTELHRWVNIFNDEFKLEVLPISLSVDRLRSDRLGQFRYGCNGFGLRREIIIAQGHIYSGENADILATVLHELLHAWQESHGKPGRRNYHNVEFRRTALRYGLSVDQRGVTAIIDDTPFTELLEKYGVELPTLPTPALPLLRPGTQKLRLWECQCDPPVKVRVGRREFHSRCLECGQLFKLQPRSTQRLQRGVA